MNALTLFLIGLSAVGLFFLGRLYLRQNRIIFRPGPLLDRTPADLNLDYEELHLISPSGIKIWTWWVPFEQSSRVLIYFHGSDGNITHELPVIRFLHSLRINTLIVEYPGYQANGMRPRESSCNQAADAAWNFLVSDKNYASEDIILFGHSLGSGVATYLAATRRTGGLAILSGFTSIPDLAALMYPFLPVRLFVHTKMNSLDRIRKCDCPVLILHSEKDEQIPISHAKKLYAQARGPKKLISFSGRHTGHNWLKVNELQTAFRQLLRGDLETWEVPETGSTDETSN
jgi:fermentation-respiration switch protein FrsA (DUF1100 family)